MGTMYTDKSAAELPPAEARRGGQPGKEAPAMNTQAPPPQGKPAARTGPAPTFAPGLAQTWLAWQCRMVAGIIRGALFPVMGGSDLGPAVAMWPGSGEGEAQLLKAAGEALEERKGVVRARQPYGPQGKRTCDVIACPLLIDGNPVAVITVMISVRSAPQQHAVLQLLQWGGMWIESLLQQQATEQKGSGAYTLSLTTAIVCHTASHAAAIEVVNRLAERVECERVSIGFRRGMVMRLQALSHVASFDSRTQLVRRIEAAMEEAVDQKMTVMIPADSPERASAVSRAHTELAEQQGNGAVCSVPLPGQAGEIIGAITLERGASQPFDHKTVEWLESLARVIGPALEIKRREERGFFAKGLEALTGGLAGLLGPTAFKTKLAVLAVFAWLAFFSIVSGDYRVTAPATIEGAERQVLVAPQAGYMETAKVRAGDLVKKGDLIATLDDRDLRLELQKWQSERNKIEKEYQEALAKRDRTELSVLRAKLDQVDAEMRLVDEKLRRTELRAPFDGAVVSGDFSQSLGAPVEVGQVLFEVASLDSYRVVLEVDEHDVAGITSGRRGRMVISALPDTVFPISLQQVIPVAVAAEGRNFFRIEAALEEPSAELRPGMQGVAKVDVGRRKMLWIWTHGVIDRLRLWAWSVGF